MSLIIEYPAESVAAFHLCLIPVHRLSSCSVAKKKNNLGPKQLVRVASYDMLAPVTIIDHPSSRRHQTRNIQHMFLDMQPHIIIMNSISDFI